LLVGVRIVHGDRRRAEQVEHLARRRVVGDQIPVAALHRARRAVLHELDEQIADRPRNGARVRAQNLDEQARRRREEPGNALLTLERQQPRFGVRRRVAAHGRSILQAYWSSNPLASTFSGVIHTDTRVSSGFRKGYSSRPRYFFASLSICASAPSSVSSARPLTATHLYELFGSRTSSDTRGSCSRWRGFARPRAVLKPTVPSATSTHTTVVCGDPSSRSVVATPTKGLSSTNFRSSSPSLAIQSSFCLFPSTSRAGCVFPAWPFAIRRNARGSVLQAAKAAGRSSFHASHRLEGRPARRRRRAGRDRLREAREPDPRTGQAGEDRLGDRRAEGGRSLPGLLRRPRRHARRGGPRAVRRRRPPREPHRPLAGDVRTAPQARARRLLLPRS